MADRGVSLGTSTIYRYGNGNQKERLVPPLAQGEKVKISGFGNFVVREKHARKGRNPQTGQEILLEARRVLTFKPSLVLKNVLNETEVDASEIAAGHDDADRLYLARLGHTTRPADTSRVNQSQALPVPADH